MLNTQADSTILNLLYKLPSYIENPQQGSNTAGAIGGGLAALLKKKDGEKYQPEEIEQGTPNGFSPDGSPLYEGQQGDEQLFQQPQSGQQSFNDSDEYGKTFRDILGSFFK